MEETQFLGFPIGESSFPSFIYLPIYFVTHTSLKINYQPTLNPTLGGHTPPSSIVLLVIFPLRYPIPLPLLSSPFNALNDN